MKLTKGHGNIFVLGDLVLDQLVPVTEKQTPHQPVGHERVFDGQPRKTIAGGAANCARLLSALSTGRVCLWGLSGNSPLGKFADILESSQARLGARRVIFYGVHNESQMNTITRFVSTDSTGVHYREFRIDDVQSTPVTESQRRDAVAYLKAELSEHGVDAIILNDQDMKALNEQLIFDISELAKANSIPLFVDPKRDWGKYNQAYVTCALPNLAEWCHIVHQPDDAGRWRAALNASSSSLINMADLCLRHMGNALFHIIKCDQDGLVLISPTGSGRRQIHHILPHPTPRPILFGQLGAGDILVATLALEYTAIRNEPDSGQRMLAALAKANAVVASYLELDWQQVPTDHVLDQFQLKELEIKQSAETPGGAGLICLISQDIDLREFSVLESGLVSSDPTYIATVKDLVDFLSTGWDSSNVQSAILTGKGGVGKSELLELLKLRMGKSKVGVWNLDHVQIKTKCPDVDTTLKMIKRRLAQRHKLKGLLIIIDEAFSKAGHLLLGESGKMLLQGVARLEPRTRFLFTDASYLRYRDEISRSQFESRCKLFILPSLDSRRCDIPYIFAKGCLDALRNRRIRSRRIESIRISESVLVAVSNWILNSAEDDQNARVLVNKASEIALAAVKQHGNKTGTLEISNRHLPTDIRKAILTVFPKQFITFSW